MANEELTTQIAALTTAVANLATQLTAFGQEVGELKKNIEQTNTLFTALKEDMNRYDENIQLVVELADGRQKGFRALERRVDVVESELKALRPRFSHAT